MTATTHHHRPTHRYALLALGLPAAIGAAWLAGGNFERESVPTIARRDATVVSTNRVTSMIPAHGPVIVDLAADSELSRVTSPIPGHTIATNPPTDVKRGLHRVNSPVSGPSLTAPIARVKRS